MLTLAIETSSSHGGIAIVRDGEVLHQESWTREKSHSELVTAKIHVSFNNAGLQLKDLNSLAVGIGPGSFTGIRVAINVARSLGYALQLPVFVFDSTEILAAGVQRTDLPVATLINAQKNSVFASTFEYSTDSRCWVRKQALGLFPLEKLEDVFQTQHLCVGDAFNEFQSHLPSSLTSNLVRDPSQTDFPEAAVLGQLAWRFRDSRQPLDWNQVQALYIRASGAEEKIREGHGK